MNKKVRMPAKDLADNLLHRQGSVRMKAKSLGLFKTNGKGANPKKFTKVDK